MKPLFYSSKKYCTLLLYALVYCYPASLLHQASLLKKNPKKRRTLPHLPGIITP